MKIVLIHGQNHRGSPIITIGRKTAGTGQAGRGAVSKAVTAGGKKIKGDKL